MSIKFYDENTYTVVSSSSKNFWGELQNNTILLPYKSNNTIGYIPLYSEKSVSKLFGIKNHGDYETRYYGTSDSPTIALKKNDKIYYGIKETNFNYKYYYCLDPNGGIWSNDKTSTIRTYTVEGDWSTKKATLYSKDFGNVTRYNYTFQGWSVWKISGTTVNTSYVSSSFTISVNTTGSYTKATFYAIWKRNYTLYETKTTTSGSMSSGTGFHTYTLNVTFSKTVSEEGVKEPSLSLSWAVEDSKGLAYNTNTKVISNSSTYTVYRLDIVAFGGNSNPGQLQVNGQLIDTSNNVIIGNFRTYTSSDWLTSSSSGGGSSGGGGGSGRE